VKWAFGSQGGFVETGQAALDAGSEWGRLLGTRQAPDEIRLANVAGAAAVAALAGRLAERFGIPPRMASSPAHGAGVRNGYANPGQLGVDRWLALCAAFVRYRASLCVLDVGTASTIDRVTADGRHEGGLILPGITLMAASLRTRTGDLARLADDPAGSSADSPVPAVTEGRPALGRDTAAAIRLAALQATACLALDCIVPRGGGLLVVTGGAAPPLLPVLKGLAAPRGIRLEHCPDLVLEGLALEPTCATFS